MRIAVTGTHRTGKSTLVAALAAALPGYDAVDEPYVLLEEEGHAFEDEPGFDDFEAMLTRSVGVVSASGPDGLFDRCPLDLLAYLAVDAEAERLDARAWLPRLQEAMAMIDLVVLVPIERPDRIDAGGADDRELRRRVDEALRDIVLDDPWGFGVPVLEVSGSPDERADQVLAYLRENGLPAPAE